ncbi:MAG TPA: dipeptidase PepE [Terriglobales bacterium]|jgi:dipeptidase E|nr:dipeptidase PepE [Terriglobales bacterium]
MNTGATSRLLLISNSTLHGSGYLDHVEKEIRDFVGSRTKVVFVPFAVHDRHAYAAKAQERFRDIGLSLISIHDVSNMPRAVDEADVVFVGGGNTFRLLKGLYDHNLLGPIRRRVAAGVPYIGSSAGSIVACPTLKTTKDMPVVQPPSFEALGLVPFQISPHYLDPDPSSTHMGETQEERIVQFLEENGETVVGLREGSVLRVEDGAVTLKGRNTARIFRRGEEPVEATPGSNLSGLLEATASRTGRVA